MSVLALGIDTAGAAALRARQGLLQAYAMQAGRQFHAARTQAASLAQTRQTLTEECLLRARQVIHEVGNPLGVVHNYLAILRDRLANEPESAQEIELIREELRRVSGILQTLRQTGASADGAAQRLDLNALIGQVLENSVAGVNPRWPTSRPNSSPTRDCNPSASTETGSGRSSST